MEAESDISPQTFTRRIGDGTWRAVLAAADLEDRYGGKPVTSKMRALPSRQLTDQEVLAEMRRLADANSCLTKTALRRSQLMNVQTPATRFGSWPAALKAAGLRPSRMARRWTDEELAANLQALRADYGRPPTMKEMRRAPSVATPDTYRRRFGSPDAAEHWLDARTDDAEASDATSPNRFN